MSSTDLVTKIMRYESGTMSDMDQLTLFAEMIQSGTVWKLQGSYGRSAAWFIKSGYITEDGHVTDKYERYYGDYADEAYPDYNEGNDE